MSYSLGIDLGTTYSAAATADRGRVEIATLGSIAPAIPSIVVLRADGEVVVGEAAERRAITEPTRTAREFKRRLGDPAPLVLGGTPYGAEALMAHLLRSIVAAVTERQGRPPAAIVVTHPANYGPYKKDLLAEMVRLADVGEVEFFTEPEAAAVNYAEQDRLEPGHVVAVYDFGGGTFDAAVLRKTEQGFELLGQPEGMERLGGIDFDHAIFAYVDDAVGGQISEADVSDPMTRAALARLRADVRAAKESLSTDTDVTIPVMLPRLQTEVRLTRPEFEAMVRPRIAETIGALERAIRSAGVPMSGIAKILLVGGSSRIPLVAEMVREATGRPVAVDAHPKFAIALGAARAGAQQLDAAPLGAVVAPREPAATMPGVAVVTAAQQTDGRHETRARRGGRRMLVAAAGAMALLLVAAVAALAIVSRGGDEPVATVSSDAPPAFAATSTPTPSGAPAAVDATPAPSVPAAATPPADAAVVTTVAGITRSGYSGDGGPAVAAQLGRVGGLAVDRDGALYISDYENSNARVVRDGTIATLVSDLYLPEGIDVDADGNVYVADTGNHRIVRVAPDGELTKLAGGSVTEYGLAGDGGPATDALLYQPAGVLVADDGSVYLSDTGNHRVRRVDSSGIITTVAGTGAQGFFGDGGPAVAAQLNRPRGLALDRDGNLYIADSYNGMIRKVDTAGIITTFAGVEGGYFEDPVDGAAATATSFHEVSTLAIDAGGNLFANPVRIVVRIDPGGTVEIVGGTGSQDVDGVPPTEVSFGEIWAIAVDRTSGTLYVSSGTRVRAIPGVAETE